MDTLYTPIPDCAGRVYSNFHARRDPATGPGWYVFGRAQNVSANVVMLCARPNVPARKHPKYNGRVRRGWKTKSRAGAVAACMKANLEE